MLFCRLFYLIYSKYCQQDEEFVTNEDLSNLNELHNDNVNAFIAEYEEQHNEDEEYEQEYHEEEY